VGNRGVSTRTSSPPGDIPDVVDVFNTVLRKYSFRDLYHWLKVVHMSWGLDDSCVEMAWTRHGN
jgi:hypothetical protein